MLRRIETVAIDEDMTEQASELRAANERLLKTSLRSLKRPEAVPPADPIEPAMQPAPAPTPEPEPMQPSPTAQPRFTPKPEGGRGARRGMDALREQALQNLISQVEDRNFGGLRNRRLGRGILTPSRLILIAVALIAGGLAAFLAASVQPPPPPPPEVITEVVSAPTARVLVAKQPILLGQRVTASALEWTEWPEAALRPEYVTEGVTPDAITEMTGAVVRAEINPGEPVLESKLVHADGSFLAGMLTTGMRGVSVAVTADAASGGFIAPNDRVDVISTRILASGHTTETILRNVRVLALNNRLAQDSPRRDDEDEADTAFSGKALATLELSDREAELVVNAQALGDLTLVLRSITDAGGSPPVAADQDAFNQTIRATSPFWTR